MADQMLVTCFTDLKDSTVLTQTLGHNIYRLYLDNHFSIAKVLTQLAGGEYIKNTGDGNIATFASGEQAVTFALQLLEFYTEQPCLKRPPFKIGIGLYLGQVQRTESDVFGSGVNQAARVQGKAEVGHIVINADLLDNLKRQWGPQEATKYCISIGHHTLKGISDPPTHELFSFEWQDFRRDDPDFSLAGLVYEHLRRAGVEASNISVKDLANPGTIIWPVVPRDLATAIHRGQAEIIRLLALLGWKIQLLIADCGVPDNNRLHSEAFLDALKSYMKSRDMTFSDVKYMSDLYQPHYDGYNQIQDIFRKLIAELSLDDMLMINNKTYDAKEQEENKRSSALKFLNPALAVAAVLYLALQHSQKCAVVAGKDEKIQWERTYRVPQMRSHLGAMMNPELKSKTGFLDKQKYDWPIWYSDDSLVGSMDSTNLAWWTFQLHAYIPAFPARSVAIEGTHISPGEWGDIMDIPELLKKESLARHVWEYLDPTR
jgi:Adenylate and Guanylate cyclase catalytic domain